MTISHRNIRPRMRAPILFQVNKWRLINYSKWPIYKGKLNSPHDILYTTLLGKIQDGGFIRAFLFSFWTPVTWQSTHSRSNISMLYLQTRALYSPYCFNQVSPLSYIIPWRSGSAWKSVAKNMADFGLCWRHLVPTATGIYHWPTAMLFFWQSPLPPWFLQKNLWLSCFQNKIFMKNSFFSLVDGGTWKNNEKMFLLTGKS